MIICDVGRALAVLSIPLVLWVGGLSFAQVLAVAFADGTLYVLFALAESSAIPKVVPWEQLTAALGQNEARVRGASMLGRPIGGALFGIARGLPFLADAVSSGLSVLTLSFIRSEFQEERTRSMRTLREEVREGLAWLWRQPFLRGTALIAAGGNLINQALTLTVIVLSKDRGASPGLIGLLLGFFGVGGLLGSLVAPWVQRRVRARTVVVGTIWLGGVLLALIGASPFVLAPGPLVGLRSSRRPVGTWWSRRTSSP